MSFLQLSPELVLEIAGYLEQIDLLNVSLVCKGLRETTKSSLHREYNNVHIMGNSFVDVINRIIDGEIDGRSIKTVRLRPWFSLSRLLDEDPDDRRRRERMMTKDQYQKLTECAKAQGLITDILSFKERSPILKIMKDFEGMLSRSDELVLPPNVYDDDMKDGDVPLDRRFCDHIRLGLEDALIILLLSLSPNLQAIRLDGVSPDPLSLGWDLDGFDFPELRRLTVSGDSGLIPFHIATLERQLLSKKLQTLEMNVASCSVVNGPIIPLYLPPRSLFLSTIRLEYSAIPYPDMETLLRACCALRSFFMSLGRKLVCLECVNPAQLVESLSRHRKTLEYFGLRQYQSDHPGMQVDIPSLAEFTALKKIEVDADDFKFVEANESNYDYPDEKKLRNVLPPSLEQLDILFGAGCDGVSLADFQDFLTVREKTCPALKSVRIVTAHPNKVRRRKAIPEKLTESLRVEYVGIDSFMRGESCFVDAEGYFDTPQKETRWNGTQYVQVPVDYTRRFEMEKAIRDGYDGLSDDSSEYERNFEWGSWEESGVDDDDEEDEDDEHGGAEAEGDDDIDDDEDENDQGGSSPDDSSSDGH
ncbi:hypothetical protein BU24DRAFT_427993 [Aaosphaeria arxii CBS 175.79]|uniref:F-box domain-containing protein n=1 Tax=Aaosphaeria arxii CBS 175.79 TaxID=1450172 RepID=A0A6A5XAG8_9PLEO|nr:uncharacterized protein BU24DRAFT_427993 [Aaosphaeria arxii CBS 175.79]KAF2009952.1 hypothetical protein BU24DRAFT_427993 [Aaosphaeria arxii CBS 175.79]